ncbi:MAG: DegV family protein [Bacillota bacterium]|nr:DegV family protein [Bacillota bacterium]
MRTAIVTDSTAYIPLEVREKWNIHMIPLQVIFNDEAYEEEVNLTTSEFYEKIKHSDLPKTSQPPIGQFVELFERLASEGYEAVISIHLSSGVSGTYQGAIAAGGMVEGIKVYAFDSEISCMAQGFYVLDAAEMAAQGEEPAVIMARLEDLKTTADAYFMADDLSHFVRGGRLTSTQAFIGGLLQVKPLLHFENKVIVPAEKIRTRKKALKRVAELLGEAISGKSEPYRAVVIHANREAEAIEWKSELEAMYPSVEFSISYFGPVIGTHIGEGGMGMGWMKK